jgi:acyl-CoA synthetase (NDP forming)
VIAVVAATRANDVGDVLTRLAPVIDRHPERPVAVVVLGADGPTTVGERRAPVFDLPERAVASLARAARYAAWRREPLGQEPHLSDVDSSVARGVVHTALAYGGGWQPHSRIADILGRYGIPVVPTITAIGVRSAIAASARLGFPVVMKAADPNLVHKSDIGAVKLRLADDAAVEQAYKEMAIALDQVDPPVLIQPMGSGQVELVAGIAHDP